MQLMDFENRRWKKSNQQEVFRHRQAIDLITSGEVLDLGCGDGLFLEMLNKKRIKCCGLDISQVAVDKCRKNGFKADVFDFASDKIPHSDNQFRFVVLLDVLEHLYNPSQALKEAVRVGEKVIFAVPNFNSFPARIQMVLGMIPENNKHKQGHIFWFNYSVIEKMLEDNSWKAEIYYNTFWENKIFVGRILKLLSHVMPSIFALTFMVKIEKK